MSEKITVKAPAKLNLCLDIKGVLSNGYHLMDMIMQSVSLYEIVEIEKNDDIQLFLCNCDIAANESNTAFKAAKYFFEETAINGGAKITVRKNIPVCAGMAGGSADAAAVLVGLNELYKAGLTEEKLCEIGVKIGADVPFSIVGGTAHVTGIGDEIEKISPCPECFFVVCMPDEGISTAKAFEKFDNDGVSLNFSVKSALNAIENTDLQKLCNNMANVLQVCSESKHNDFICDKLKSSGALTALMTGSGAAVFGVFDNEKNAEIAFKEMSRFYKSWVLKPVNHGAYFEK